MSQDFGRVFSLPTVTATPAQDCSWARQIGALLLLALLAPPLLVVCLIIRLDSPGPILFVQTRIGRHGRPFRIFKLRTMVDGHPSRITRAGRWIRRLGIDEIPQLINVAKGEMALIGPRPLTLDDCRDYLVACSARFDVLPGVTGLAQATGRHLPPHHRERLDRFYVDRRSFVLDILVLTRTIDSIARTLFQAPPTSL